MQALLQQMFQVLERWRKKMVKMVSERKTNASTDRMVHGSTPQLLGMLSSSYANPPMAGGAGGVTHLTFTNSSRRKTQSLMSVPRQVQTKWQRELEDVRQKRKELVNHQHRYAKRRQELGKQRAAELQKSEADRENDEEVILEMEKDVAERH